MFVASHCARCLLIPACRKRTGCPVRTYRAAGKKSRGNESFRVASSPWSSVMTDQPEILVNYLPVTCSVTQSACLLVTEAGGRRWWRTPASRLKKGRGDAAPLPVSSQPPGRSSSPVISSPYQPQVEPLFSFLETYSQTFSDKRPSMLCDFQVVLLQVASVRKFPLGPPCRV